MDRKTAVGRWLRNLREELGFSQEEVGEACEGFGEGYPKATISRIETGQRRVPKDRMAYDLAKKFRIEEHLHDQFKTCIRSKKPTNTEFEKYILEIMNCSANLPLNLIPVIQRDNELNMIKKLIQTDKVRLITLIGPPGVGKTKLALSVASEICENYSKGVRFIVLESLAQTENVIPAVAAMLDVKEALGKRLIDQIKEQWYDKDVLLVIDNFEHLISAASVIHELVMGLTKSTVIVTSREPLGLTDEQIFEVRPLTVPSRNDLNDLSIADILSNYGAINLFIERMQLVKPTVDFDNETLLTIARICIELDGLPLAIELVAAQLYMMSPHALEKRLIKDLLKFEDNSVRPSHQKTLGATIKWSFDLLSYEEQRTLISIGVFTNSFSLEAVEDVCSSYNQIKVLVARGLVVVQDEDEPRYRMLETIRSFAQDYLKQASEVYEIYRRHALYFMTLVEKLEKLYHSDLDMWLDLLDRDFANIQTAFNWLIEHETKSALRLAAAFWRYWFIKGEVSKGIQCLEDVILKAREENMQVPASVLFGAASFQINRGHYEIANSYLVECLDIYKHLNNVQGRADTLNSLSGIAIILEDFETAIDIIEESLSLFRELKDKMGLALALNNLADLYLLEKDYARALELAQESINLGRTIKNKFPLSVALVTGGTAAAQKADWDYARTMLKESINIKKRLKDKEGIAFCLEGFAMIACGIKNFERAACLLTISNQIRQDIGSTLRPPEAVVIADLERCIEIELDISLLNTQKYKCQRVRLNQAISYALET